ncbi:unnamed protein product, partial [Timema podura]|nr:unnamed protein product [Timema podura]
RRDGPQGYHHTGVSTHGTNRPTQHQHHHGGNKHREFDFRPWSYLEATNRRCVPIGQTGCDVTERAANERRLDLTVIASVSFIKNHLIIAMEKNIHPPHPPVPSTKITQRIGGRGGRTLTSKNDVNSLMDI